MLLSEAFETYRQDVIVFSGQSPKTEENHNICLRALLVFFGDTQIESLNLQMVRDWKLELEKHRATDTVRNYVVRFRVVLAHCQKLGLPVIDYTLIPVPKRADRVPTFVSPEDVQKLIDHCLMNGNARKINRIRNAAMISLLYASGLRVSELCALNRDELRDGKFTVVGKGKKARLCFYDVRSMRYIDQYLALRTDNNPALFTADSNGLRITPGGVQEVFKNATRAAGFTKPIHPHIMRHSYATNLMQNGMHIYQLKELMGHSNISTTQVYLHVTDPQLQESYEQYHTI